MIMSFYKSALILALASSILAQNCTFNDIKCPSTGEFNVCGGASLGTNIIFRCSNGCPQPGNCNDNLAGVPPVGVKTNAKCYQDSAISGNAQCTFDCVAVTRADGSSFYPVGCTSSSSSASSASISSSSPSTGTNPSGSGSASVSQSASVTGTATVSQSATQTGSPTETVTSQPTGGDGGQGGGQGGDQNGGGGVVISSTTYFTTTLPGGQLSTGSSVVIATATSVPPALAGDGNALEVVKSFEVIAIAALFAAALI